MTSCSLVKGNSLSKYHAAFMFRVKVLFCDTVQSGKGEQPVSRSYFHHVSGGNDLYDTVLSGRRGTACRKIILLPCLGWKCCFMTPFSLVDLSNLTKDLTASMFRVEMLFFEHRLVRYRGTVGRRILLPSCLGWKCFVIPFSLVSVQQGFIDRFCLHFKGKRFNYVCISVLSVP